MSAEFNFATVGAVYNDGLSLIFDGESSASSKHYRCNSSVLFTAGDRVKITADSGTYVVDYVVGSPATPTPPPTGGITVTRLWSSSTGSSQTITLDLSEYKLVMLTFRAYSSTSDQVTVVLPIDGVSKQVTGAYKVGTSQMYYVARIVTVASNKITFGGCYAVEATIGTGVSRTSYMSCLAVDGIK